MLVLCRGCGLFVRDKRGRPDFSVAVPPKAALRLKIRSPERSRGRKVHNRDVKLACVPGKLQKVSGAAKLESAPLWAARARLVHVRRAAEPIAAPPWRSTLSPITVSHNCESRPRCPLRAPPTVSSISNVVAVRRRRPARRRTHRRRGTRTAQSLLRLERTSKISRGSWQHHAGENSMKPLGDGRSKSLRSSRVSYLLRLRIGRAPRRTRATSSRRAPRKTNARRAS